MLQLSASGGYTLHPNPCCGLHLKPRRLPVCHSLYNFAEVEVKEPGRRNRKQEKRDGEACKLRLCRCPGHKYRVPWSLWASIHCLHFATINCSPGSYTNRQRSHRDVPKAVARRLSPSRGQYDWCNCHSGKNTSQQSGKFSSIKECCVWWAECVWLKTLERGYDMAKAYPFSSMPGAHCMCACMLISPCRIN